MLLLRVVISVVTVLAGLAAAPAQAARASERGDVSLENLMTKSLDGRDLRVRRELSRTSQYTRYAISFKGADLRITGIMNVPRGKGPFPVVVLAGLNADPNTQSPLVAWGPERPIYGKVRYMTSDSARRKLRLNRYLARWEAGTP